MFIRLFIYKYICLLYLNMYSVALPPHMFFCRYVCAKTAVQCNLATMSKRHDKTVEGFNHTNKRINIKEHSLIAQQSMCSKEI